MLGAGNLLGITHRNSEFLPSEYDNRVIEDTVGYTGK